jgi:DNA-binding NarL/FixJ family response regulator
MHSSTQHVLRALQAGAIGYVLKDSAGSEVVDAVREAHAGRRYLSPKIETSAVDGYVAERHRESPLDALSGRERQILQLIVEGRSNEEAGKALFLSRKTVETYRSRMMRKLDIPDLPRLVKVAIPQGVTQLD